MSVEAKVKKLLTVSAFSVFVTRSSFCFLGWVHSPWPVSSDLSIYRKPPHYSSYAFSNHVPFHLSLSFSDSSLTYPNLIPIFFPAKMSLLPLTVHFLLISQYEKQVFLQLCHFLTCVTWFPTHCNGDLLYANRNYFKDNSGHPHCP